MTLTLVVIFAAGLACFAISAIAGGGAGLMLMPILGALLPIQQIPAALSIGTFGSAASRIAVFRRSIHWPIVKIFVPAALPAVWLGAWALKFIEPLYLELAMGLFLIGNLPMALKRTPSASHGTAPRRRILALIGFCAGVLSALTGAVGLLFNRFYLQYGLSKEQIVATRAANEILLHLFKIVLYAALGLLTQHGVAVGLVIGAAALLSAFSTKWLLSLMSEPGFRRIGYSAMVLSGVAMLAQSMDHLVHRHRVDLEARLMTKGVETHLRWQDARYAMEFTYDEGFEFEQVIPLTDLSREQQAMVDARRAGADRVVVEVVYRIGSQSYEAYYFQGPKLVDKIDFR